MVYPLNGYYASFKSNVIHNILFSYKRTVYIKSKLESIVFICLYVFFILGDVWKSRT